MNNNRYTIDSVRNNWRILDEIEMIDLEKIRIVSHERFSGDIGNYVEYIKPGFVTNIIPEESAIFYFLYAVRLFRCTDVNSVVIVNGGVTFLWLWCGLLNAFPIFGKRKLFSWDIFVEYILGKEKKIDYVPFIKISTQLKDKFARYILKQYGINVLWSSKQVATHAKHFNIPEDKFIFIPYKANHSKSETYDVPINNFIFSGGNGKRDYKCLVEAVRGTDIPVIISATDNTVRKKIEILPNIIVVSASEPAFAKLQAASRLVVVPMIYSGLKGGGEANFCNAMWHKKPVIASDSIAADDYIIDGDTGYVVPSGDSKMLRERILKLWEDKDLCSRMGTKARIHVENNFTHEKFISRLIKLASLFGSTRL